LLAALKLFYTTAAVTIFLLEEREGERRGVKGRGQDGRGGERVFKITVNNTYTTFFFQ